VPRIVLGAGTERERLPAFLTERLVHDVTKAFHSGTAEGRGARVLLLKSTRAAEFRFVRL